MAPAPTVDGVVLCGGASRRMGRDKSLLVVDGQAMARRVADALTAAGAGRVVAQGGDEAQLRALGMEVIPDDEVGAGPLPATIQALRASPAEVVLVVGCDLVAPSASALRTTVDALLAAPDALVALPIVAGHRQWVHAAWRPQAADPLAAARAAGATSLRAAAAALPAVEVSGLDPRALVDADAPADLAGSLRPMDLPEIDVQQLADLRASGVALIDVREDDEYAQARVPGAQHIPLGQVPDRVAEVPREGTVYVICARGGRSAKAAEHYRSLGIDAVNVAGGTLAWIDAGLPTDSGGS
jgi:molybdopterin-guanine dinucleotide biosynthesis protein A/rhodanese-related sulfurtransferase